MSWFTSLPFDLASFEGVILAKSLFWLENGLVSWNPFWYLGYPSKFDMQPGITLFLAFLAKVFSFWSVLSWYRVLTCFGLVMFVISFGWLIYHLTQDKKIVLFSLLSFIFLPSFVYIFPQVFIAGREFGWPKWIIFSTTFLGTGSRVLALGFLPLALLVFEKFLKNGNKRNFIASTFLFSVILLIDLSFATGLFLGAFSIYFVSSFLGEIAIKTERFLSVVVFSLALISFWYTPGFWLHLVTASSLGGRAVYKVFKLFADIFLGIVPLVLIFLKIKKAKNKKNQPWLIANIFLLIFIVLTLLRFVSDWDFWQDYTVWGLELDMGLAMVAGIFCKRIYNSEKKALIVVFFSAFLVFDLACFPKWKRLFQGRARDEALEKRVVGVFEKAMGNFDLTSGVESETDTLGVGQRVFVSGSPVFWLNYFSYNISQVRGGSDQMAVHPFWAHGAYQIREGTDPELAKLWLESLGALMIAIHTTESKESYKDFKHPEKFEYLDGWGEVWREDGDVIYKYLGIEGVLARVVELDKMKQLSSPKDGLDIEVLREYVEVRDEFKDNIVKYSWLRPDSLELEADLLSGQGISLAVSYFKGWKSSDGHLSKDGLGNILFVPKGSSDKIRLEYKQPWVDKLGIVFSFLSLVGMYFYPRSWEWLKKKMPKLHILGGEDE